MINEFLKKKIKNFTIEESSLIGHYLSSDIIDESTGKIFYEAGFEIDEDFINFIGISRNQFQATLKKFRNKKIWKKNNKNKWEIYPIIKYEG